jgi:RNA polymerase sigma factor (sigma-70 family)
MMPKTQRYTSPRKFFSGEMVEFTPSSRKYLKHQSHLAVVKKILIRREPYRAVMYMVDCDCGAKLMPQAPQLSLAVPSVGPHDAESVSRARSTYFLKEMGFDESGLSPSIEDQVRDLLSRLPEREKNVLTLRYGLDGNYNKTLQQIGEIHGVTRERIRQIAKRAMRRAYLAYFDEVYADRRRRTADAY